MAPAIARMSSLIITSTAVTAPTMLTSLGMRNEGLKSGLTQLSIAALKFKNP